MRLLSQVELLDYTLLCRVGRLYHTDNNETFLRWRKEGQQQIDSDEEDDGNQLVDANDLDQDEQLLERLV